MSRFLKIKQRGLIKNEGIPNVYIRNISISVNKIVIDLSMKDRLNPKKTGGTWFTNPNILNNLKIKTILYQRGLLMVGSLWRKILTAWLHQRSELSPPPDTIIPAKVLYLEQKIRKEMSSMKSPIV